MKLTLISNEIPYPPTHGGRVDVWRRIQAFARANVELQLVCWSHDEPASTDIEHISEYVKLFKVYPIKKSISFRLNRMFKLLRYPLPAVMRSLDEDQMDELLPITKEFAPDAVWLDGLYGGTLAFRLAEELHIPTFTRSHNIEHIYMARQCKLAPDVGTKLNLKLANLHLQQFEMSMLKNSKLFYDISIDDLNFWQRKGFSNGRWLPPFIEESYFNCGDPPTEKADYDIVFLGNLHTPNNIEGIRWFISEVLPVILQNFPHVNLLIAGSKPSEAIIKLCGQHKNIQLLPDPPDAMQVYRSGNILINPVLQGSGVNIKSIEMLCSGRTVVSTKQGVYGLPKEVRSQILVATNAHNFADVVSKALSGRLRMPRNLQKLKELFSGERIHLVLRDIQSMQAQRGYSAFNVSSLVES